MEETVHTTTVARVLHQSKLYGRVEISSNEILPRIRPKAGRLQGQFEEGYLVWWDKNFAFWPSD